MSADPYAWLELEGAPRLLVEMLRIRGVTEIPGSKNNPVILSWARTLGMEKEYTADSIPWCGLAMAIACNRAGLQLPKQPLWALNWAKWGNLVTVPMLGDVMVKSRDGGGHVTMYVGEDDNYFHCLGGNQSDAVRVSRFPKKDDWRFRRTDWKVAQPPNVRRVFLAPTGTIERKMT